MSNKRRLERIEAKVGKTDPSAGLRQEQYDLCIQSMFGEGLTPEQEARYLKLEGLLYDPETEATLQKYEPVLKRLAAENGEGRKVGVTY